MSRDRRKLTFFFSVTSQQIQQQQFFARQAVPRIDFRTLVRDLYQIYRTRIWMYCIDKDKTNTNRGHNREKFQCQLQKDVGRFQAGAQSFNGTIGNGRPSVSSSNSNSLRALVEQDESEAVLQFNQAELDDLEDGMVIMQEDYQR
jgi:cell fate regulator YaaT (PSP1 superfamily)